MLEQEVNEPAHFRRQIATMRIDCIDGQSDRLERRQNLGETVRFEIVGDQKTEGRTSVDHEPDPGQAESSFRPSSPKLGAGEQA
jgi:hypothetical protein